MGDRRKPDESRGQGRSSELPTRLVGKPKEGSAELRSTEVPTEILGTGAPATDKARSTDLPTQVVGARQSRDSQGERAGGSTERYQHGAEIGRGGMGRVIEAVDSALGRTVAVKEALATDWDSVRRFEREMKLTAELEHPAIVPVYDRGRGANGRPFYVMRRLSGRPLSRLVAERATLGDRLTLLPSFLSAVDAVAYAHRRGILHRDLKPSNVVIGDLGEVSVIDWGLAKRLGDSDEPEPELEDLIDTTHPGSILGSPGFMSPEQAWAEEVDERADVFALGACLYFLLSGTSPHGNGSAEELLDRADRPVRPLREVVAGVPPDLLAIVDKALAHEREDRYPDAAALGAELRRFLAGQLVAAYHYTPLQRFKRFVARHRIAVAATVSAVVVVVAVTAFAAGRVIDERDQANRARVAEEIARRDAEERADDLLLTQAATRVDSNPAATVGLLRYLSPDSDRWAEARVVAAAAAARGVPWGYQLHRDAVIGLRSSPDKRVAASADRHGRIVIHDTQHRVARELVVIPDLLGFAWLGDDALVISATDQLAMVDVRSGQVRQLGSRGRRAALVGNRSGTVVVVSYRDGSMAVLRPGQKQLLHMDKVGKGAEVAKVSEDGALVALSMNNSLQLARLSQSSVAVLAELDGGIYVDFAPDGARLAYSTQDEIFEMELRGDQLVELLRYPAEMGMPFYAGKGLFHLSIQGAAVRLVRANMLTLGGAIGNVVLSSFSECGGALCVANNGGTVRIFDAAGPIELDTGSRGMTRMDATQDAILATGNGAVLVWPLDMLLPQRFDGRIGSIAHIVGDQALIFGSRSEGGHSLWWQSMVDGRITELGELMPMARVAAHADSPLVLSFDPMQVVRVHRAGDEPRVLSKNITLGDWFEPDRLLASDERGRIVEIDLDTAEQEVLFEHDGPVGGVAARGKWRLAIHGKGAWRTNRESGHEETIEGTFSRSAIGSRGTAYLADAATIMVWPPNEPTTELASLDHPVVDLTIGDAGLIAITADNSLVRIDPDGKDDPHLVHARADDSPRVTHNGRFAMVRSGSDALVYDLIVGRAYARPAKAGKYALSPDGRTLATSKHGRLLVWRDPVPAEPDQLRAWLAQVTNALVGSTGEVAWPSN